MYNKRFLAMFGLLLAFNNNHDTYATPKKGHTPVKPHAATTAAKQLAPMIITKKQGTLIINRNPNPILVDSQVIPSGCVWCVPTTARAIPFTILDREYYKLTGARITRLAKNTFGSVTIY